MLGPTGSVHGRLQLACRCGVVGLGLEGPGRSPLTMAWAMEATAMMRPGVPCRNTHVGEHLARHLGEIRPLRQRQLLQGRTSGRRSAPTAPLGTPSPCVPTAAPHLRVHLGQQQLREVEVAKVVCAHLQRGNKGEACGGSCMAHAGAAGIRGAQLVGRGGRLLAAAQRGVGEEA